MWIMFLIIAIIVLLFLLLSGVSIVHEAVDGNYLYLILFLVSMVVILSYIIRQRIQSQDEYEYMDNLHRKTINELIGKIKKLENNKIELEHINSDNEEAIQRKDFIINNILKTEAPFKNLSSFCADVVLCNYRHISEYLRTKQHPARKSADIVSRLREETRSYIEQYKEMLYRYEFILSQFPELGKYIDNYEEVSSICEDIANRDTRKWVDKTTEWLTKEEYMNLNENERNQLALDRYVSRNNKTNWQIGRDYELYIGHIYRREGWKVIQYGIEKKLNDLGRDIIAQKNHPNGNHEVLIIQCKIWNKNKEIHENTICQLFGTAIQYMIEHNYSQSVKVRPVLVTTTTLSDTAMQFARHLGVQVRIEQLDKFPRIKCNINKATGEKIYHLPFDQQYDSAKIENDGEFYAHTVKEAADKGFRHAYRWFWD